MLPEEAFINLKLTYYDDVTPEDYHAPGFVATNVNSKCKLPENCEPMTTTSISTGFHKLKVQIESACLPGNPQLQVSQISTTEETERRKCICDLDPDLDLEVKFDCKKCGLSQHGVCYLIFNQNQVQENCLCAICAVESGNLKMCANKKVARLVRDKPESVANTMFFRRCLVYCNNVDKISPEMLAQKIGFSAEVAQKAFQKMLNEEIVSEDGIVDQEKLKRDVGPTYLGKNSEFIFKGDGKVAGDSVELDNMMEEIRIDVRIDEKKAKKRNFSDNDEIMATPPPKKKSRSNKAGKMSF